MTNQTRTDEATIAATETIDEAIARQKSVVKTGYKVKYAERVLNGAKTPKGVSKKVHARSCGDWLALTIAKLCIPDTKTNKLDVPAFEALLSANGVAHEGWNRTTPGWQGRLRMTGRLALQRIVAEADGELELADGQVVIAPKSWVAAHTH